MKVFRFRFAMFFCYIAYIIFPKCDFKENLKNIMLEQGRNFRIKQIMGEGNLKEQLNKIKCDGAICPHYKQCFLNRHFRCKDDE